MSSEDFNAQVERAMLVGNRAHMRPVIEKELLHHDILFALDAEGLLDSLTFQGGTSLRLCYGSAPFYYTHRSVTKGSFEGRSVIQGLSGTR